MVNNNHSSPVSPELQTGDLYIFAGDDRPTKSANKTKKIFTS